MRLPAGYRPARRHVVAAAGALSLMVAALVLDAQASVHLPGPPNLSGGAASAGAKGPQPATAAGGSGGLASCTVSIAGASAVDGQSGESVTVKTSPGARVRLEAQYSQFTSVHATQADGSGAAGFALTDPPGIAAQTVRIIATTTVQQVQRTCEGQFTHQAPPVGCSVSVSNPSPPTGQTTEVVTVQTTPGASVRVSAHFPRFTSSHRHQASNGTAIFVLPIADPRPGFPVRISATALLWSGQSSCSTSFTPV